MYVCMYGIYAITGRQPICMYGMHGMYDTYGLTDSPYVCMCICMYVCMYVCMYLGRQVCRYGRYGMYGKPFMRKMDLCKTDAAIPKVSELPR